ncbi:MAG: S24 family peptidase [Bryobacterales bacterium]|nr:S24 family peptidase [Bryobacterales bacterium]
MAVSLMPPPKKAEYAVLRAALPGRPTLAAGILLLEPETDRLHIKLRTDWAGCAAPEDAEVLELLASDLAAQAEELGGAALLALLEDRLSNALQISERRPAVVADFERALERLYTAEVEGLRRSGPVLPFRTHLPVYSLRAAAGRFGPEQDVEAQPEDWIPLPPGLRPPEDFFACHVVGRSMEPRIPEGSLCLFRRMPAGSRQGKLVLVRHRGTAEGAEFTVKRYRSEKVLDEEGGWRHTRIVLEPLNPEYPLLELGPEDFQVIAEFVRVIPIEET